MFASFCCVMLLMMCGTPAVCHLVRHTHRHWSELNGMLIAFVLYPQRLLYSWVLSFLDKLRSIISFLPYYIFI